MKKRNFATLFIFSAVLTLAVFVFTTFTSNASEVTQVSANEEFSTALLNAENGDTIQLAANITTGAFSILDISITLDLNGYTLHAFTDTTYMTALWVGGDGELLLIGDGEFNITSVYGSGLSLSENGRAMVNNIVSGGTAGVDARGNSTAIVNGDIVCTDLFGVLATDNASVTVYGNVSGENMSIQARENASVYVTGNVADSLGTGVMATGRATTVTVRGNVSSRSVAIFSDAGATINIYGNIISTNGIAVRVNNAFATVRGYVTGDMSVIVATEGAIVNIYGDVTPTGLGQGVNGSGENTIVTVNGNILTGGISISEGATAKVYGDVYNEFNAVTTRDSGTAYIVGNVNGTVTAWGGKNTVTVIGDIIASTGVSVLTGDTELTVRTNAIRASGTGVRVSDGGIVTVYGDVYGEHHGVFAWYGSNVRIVGNVTGERLRGIFADHENTHVSVSGDVSGHTAIFASRSAVVDTNGSITGSHIGISSVMGAEVVVHGNVYGEWRSIVFSGSETTVTVYGEILPTSSGEYISYVDGIYLLIFLTARINIDLYEGDISIHVLLFITTFQSFATRTQADYDAVYNGYYIFHLGADLLKMRPAINGVHIYLDSYEIINIADGSVLQVMDVRPVIQSGRALVPVHFIAYIFGAETHWNRDTREVTIMLDGEDLAFAIGDLAPGMDVPAQIISNRTFVPLRFVGEFFGVQVYWNSGMRRVEIII